LRGLVAFALAAGSLSCGQRSRLVVRLPLPETERVTLASESRAGCWLSPGDSIQWDLPSAPRGRLEGTYSSTLAGGTGGTLELEISAVSPGERRPWRTSVSLVSDSKGWRAWSVNLPRIPAPSRLRILWRKEQPGSRANSLFLTEPSLSAARREGPRTIVLLLVDTLRADHVSAYGYPRPTTPRLDAFFAGWLRAETCLPAGNWTLPSYASLLTSASVARHGVGRYGHLLPEDLPTLAESVSRKGFRTLAVTGGGYVDPSLGFARGFDRYAVVSGPAAGAVESALSMLEEHGGEPAFLLLHTYQVHDYAPDEAAARRLFPDPTVLGPDWRESVAALRGERMSDSRFPGWIRARYDAALASVDDAFGRLLEGLGRQGRLENTAVLFTSDHGEGLCDRFLGGQCLEWGHGSPYLFEEELRVPLQARIPWNPRARGVIRGVATLLDVAPTLVHAAGAPVPFSFEGRSLLSGVIPAGRPVVTEAPPLDALALREADRKLIRRTGAVQRSLFDERASYHRFPVEECHELGRDPGEKDPVPCEPRLRERVERYLASGFPDSLVLRIPARPLGGAERRAVLRARGRQAAPAMRTFGLASPPQLSQRGALSEARFEVGLAPVWLALATLDGSRALEIEITGVPLLVTAAGAGLASGSYRWQDLQWLPAGSLPDGAALFTTPPSPRSFTAPAALSSDLTARLLSLGYLRGAPPLAAGLDPVAAEGSEGAASLSPGEVRVRSAD